MYSLHYYSLLKAVFYYYAFPVSKIQYSPILSERYIYLSIRHFYHSSFQEDSEQYEKKFEKYEIYLTDEVGSS